MAQVFLTSHAGHTSSKARKALVDKSDSTLPFPFKLHQLLEEAEDCGNDHLISWLPSGEAFKIHNPEAFEEHVMTKYFKQTKLMSFTRQLVSFPRIAYLEGIFLCTGILASNEQQELTRRLSITLSPIQYIYGFTKIAKGPNAGGFFHPEFRRVDQKACMTLSRREKKEDRRVKKNRPKMLEDLQRSLAKSRTSSTFGPPLMKDGKNIIFGGWSNVRSTNIPQSLLASFPTSIPRGEYFENTERNPRPKKALSLFDQTFGDELDLDVFLGTSSLGPISAMESQALPAPPSALGVDFQKQPLPRPMFQGFPDLPKSTAMPSFQAPRQIATSRVENDLFQMEPRSIEDMLDGFDGFMDEETPVFTSSSFFGADNLSEHQHLVMMMET
jgi:hypothetical protein